MAWRAANSLLALREQLNALAPQRSKASDGVLGNAAHSARESDHNPDAGGIVRAMDITHDPANGMDVDWLAAQLALHRDPRIKYVIRNSRIMDSRPEYRPWTWQPYSGPNPHTKHLHLSVVADARADDTRPWNLGLPGHEEYDMEWKDKLDPTSVAVEKAPLSAAVLLRGGYDWGGSNAQRLDALAAKVDQLAARPTTGTPVIDYDALAKALLRNMAAGA